MGDMCARKLLSDMPTGVLMNINIHSFLWVHPKI